MHWTCLAFGPIGSTTASSDVYKVGADSGRDGGALARVGVERLDAGERARVHLAEVLVDRLYVRSVVIDRERDDQPAREVHAAAAGGGELGGERLELLAPAAG